MPDYTPLGATSFGNPLMSDARSRIALAMMQNSTDTSPVRSWTQGLARVVQAMTGGAMLRDQQQENKDALAGIVNGVLSGGNQTPGAASMPSAPSAPAVPPDALSGTPMAQNAAPLSGGFEMASADKSQPRGFRNNNPLNIEAGNFTQSQPGFTGSDGRFAQFGSMDQGVGAADNLLQSYGKRGINTVAGIVGRWAPPRDNNPTNTYAATVAKSIGVDPNAPLNMDDPNVRRGLIGAMAQFENGRPLQMASAAAQTMTDATPMGGSPMAFSGQPQSGNPLSDSSSFAPAAAPANVQTLNTRPVPPSVTDGPQPQGLPNAKPILAPPGRANPSVPPQLAGVIRQAVSSNSPQAQALGMGLLQRYMQPHTYTPINGPDGTVYAYDNTTGEMRPIANVGAKPEKLGPGDELIQGGKVLAKNGEKKTPDQLNYEYYTQHVPAGQTPMPFDVWATQKARAGATQVSNNIDMGGPQSYDKQLAEGLGKVHAALSNGVEEAQQRARDIAAMQGAIDQIQKNGGSTGGMGQAQALSLLKTINSGASALGVSKPFSESDISDKEFLQKFNRQMAGAQAKGAVGSRVTNFEMQNFLKSNPGLDMSITGNQRLLGIQAQIEQRNIAVGNAIRQATAQSIAGGKRIDPVTVQKIITDYDHEHHITDPVTGQDLTQSYVLPEFQTGGTNAQKAQQHNQNIQKLQGKTSSGLSWSVQ